MHTAARHPPHSDPQPAAAPRRPCQRRGPSRSTAQQRYNARGCGAVRVEWRIFSTQSLQKRHGRRRWLGQRQHRGSAPCRPLRLLQTLNQRGLGNPHAPHGVVSTWQPVSGAGGDETGPGGRSIDPPSCGANAAAASSRHQRHTHLIERGPRLRHGDVERVVRCSRTRWMPAGAR